MTLNAIKKYLLEHVFGILLTALVSLASMTGGYLLLAIKADLDATKSSITRDLDSLQCRVSQFAVKAEYKAVQLKLLVTPLDDIKRSSELLAALTNIINDYRAPLGKCEQGRSDLEQLRNYKAGLESYIDRDWDGAIKHFGLITERSALTEKSIGNALYHKFDELRKMKDPKASEFERQWLARFANAHELAAQESDSSVKERAVAYLKCSVLLVNADEGIRCLNDLVEAKQANYAVYYNLSALHARKGDFESALRHMTDCLKLPGGMQQRRSELKQDDDFKKMFDHQIYGQKLEAVISGLPY